MDTLCARQIQRQGITREGKIKCARNEIKEEGKFACDEHMFCDSLIRCVKVILILKALKRAFVVMSFSPYAFSYKNKNASRSLY